MKKIFLSVVLLAIGTSVFAQMSGGLKAGLNLSNQEWSAGGVSIDGDGTGFHVGGYVNFALSETISIQPEILYNSLTADIADVEKITMNYISVPVMFMYTFAEKFNVQAGPQIGFLMSTDPSEYKDDDGYTGTDFTLNLGAGANFGKLNVGLRYGIGLSDIAGDAATDGGVEEIKNKNFQISVGYKLFGE